MSGKKDNDEYDLSSPNFDASKALKHPDKVKIPCPSAPVYENLSYFIETPDGIFPKPKRIPKETKPKESPKPGTSKEQPPNNKTDIKKENIEKIKNCKNVLTRMENTVKGPLTFIKKCMDEKLRVKVYTRSAVRVRGFCVGFIVAFDKHMNLVLRDVFETWTRKRKTNVPFLDSIAIEGKSEDIKCGDFLSRGSEREEKYNPIRGVIENKPKVIVRKRLKRKEICERHIDQLLIRGEQIVIVTLETS